MLAPYNIDVNRTNEKTLDKLPGELREYRSIDDVVSDEQGEIQYSNEFLNSLAPAGLPPRNIRLKLGSIVMLLRNLDVANGLCNGTSLIVIHFRHFVLGCKIASGGRKEKFALIPRIDSYTDKSVPFWLRRRQFPVRLVFATTVNKSQGQSWRSVRVHLLSEVFSHDQLYVALSWARRRDGVKVYTGSQRVKNIVIKAVL
ncbi:hypothetical protein OESDEN_22196 [Oesophagostomum dentatum]|uniref:DNA helicase Pif1-like 2B domain-containing protein n=1 Tax=Oesophagostomum dentatum TaxID=61180 RepID=A0A0B1RZU1_OESDE|nr:hypothetical protein OESDEN_22196 [Oesophagostomum dentatum]